MVWWRLSPPPILAPLCPFQFIIGSGRLALRRDLAVSDFEVPSPLHADRSLHLVSQEDCHSEHSTLELSGAFLGLYEDPKASSSSKGALCSHTSTHSLQIPTLDPVASKVLFTRSLSKLFSPRRLLALVDVLYRQRRTTKRRNAPSIINTALLFSPGTPYLS